MAEEWLSFDEAAQLICERYGTSIGYAEKLVKDARKSGEVRPVPPANPVYLTQDDGLIDFDEAPTSLSPFGPKHDLSKSDFVDWLSRHPDLSVKHSGRVKAGNTI